MQSSFGVTSDPSLMDDWETLTGGSVALATMTRNMCHEYLPTSGYGLEELTNVGMQALGASHVWRRNRLKYVGLHGLYDNVGWYIIHVDTVT